MKKIKDNGKFKVDRKIEELLNKVDIESMSDDELEDITNEILQHFMDPDFVFYFVGVPYFQVEKHQYLKANEMNWLDSIPDENGNACPILFTNVFHLKTVKPRLKKDEHIYSVDTGQLLEFMEINEFEHACINPDTLGMTLPKETLVRLIHQQGETE